jgi:hypothetical protein
MSEQQPDDEVIGHEPIDADARAIWYALGATVLLVLIALVAMGGLMAFLTSWRLGDTTVRAPGPPIEPPPGVTELNPNQKAELRRLRAREREMLTEYAWVDQQAGVARIPIARAMRILAKETSTAPQPQGIGNEAE